ncbi:MAG: FHA domain-containing protein FhaB/FipA [Actinomycetota bacterium]
MSPFVLSVLKYSLLVLLYFFVFRAVRSVATDVAGRRRERSAAPPRSSPAPPAKVSKGGKPPSQVVVHDPDAPKPRTVRLSGSAQIGRADACAIRLSDTYVSQMHARLYGQDGGWYVEDLGSTNGTFLNDRKVDRPVEVHAGDVVKVGKTVLELRR